MYLAEFIMGLFIGILIITCLFILIILLAADKKEESAPAESAITEIPYERPVLEGESITFFITRHEITEDTRKSGDTDITVTERPYQPQLPASLKYKGKTYAMLYGTDKGVLMIVKIDDGYADELASKYPGVRRASFPNAPNWYYVPVEGGAFKTKEEVYGIIFEARKFLASRLNNDAERQSEQAAGLILTEQDATV